MAYKTWTVNELIAELRRVAKEMPKGLDSPVYSGDFECNYLHGQHEIMKDEENDAVFIGYEMHESIQEW